MSEKQQAMQGEARVATRAAYIPPVLKTFGPVGALTQSGSGNPGEIGMNGQCRGGMMSDPMC